MFKILAVVRMHKMSNYRAYFTGLTTDKQVTVASSNARFIREREVIITGFTSFSYGDK